MYKQIASNKRKTWVLVTFFSAFIILLMVVFGADLGLSIEGSLVYGTTIAVSYSLLSFYLADDVVLLSQGAKKITKKEAYDVWNVVENLSIASGMTMPTIYLIEDSAPNAFATGRDPKHASIVFTTGLLSILEKSELEAVAAHEMSHIKNYDTRLMTIVVVLIGLIVLLSDIMLRVTFYGGGGGKKDRNGNLGIFLIVITIILAILAPIIAQMIKLAISRTREYLADSAAALMTRHPDALASALEKISSHNKKMKSANRATAHLFIATPFKTNKKKKNNWLQRLFSTHPPINDRIAKLKEMGI